MEILIIACLALLLVLNGLVLFSVSMLEKDLRQATEMFSEFLDREP